MSEFEKLDRGWSESEFQGLSFKDSRLEKRLLKVAEALSSKLQSPIYAATKDWASAKAAYRLFDNSKVTAENILAPHRAQTIARLSKEELVLAIQDTTYLNFSQGKKNKSLGPIGDKTTSAQGMVMHHTLAITPENLPLGVLTQKIWVREGFNEKTPQEQRSTTRRIPEQLDFWTCFKANDAKRGKPYCDKIGEDLILNGYSPNAAVQKSTQCGANSRAFALGSDNWPFFMTGLIVEGISNRLFPQI